MEDEMKVDNIKFMAVSKFRPDLDDVIANVQLEKLSDEPNGLVSYTPYAYHPINREWTQLANRYCISLYHDAERLTKSIHSELLITWEADSEESTDKYEEYLQNIIDIPSEPELIEPASREENTTGYKPDIMAEEWRGKRIRDMF